jgi:hypothetical protein
VPPACPVEQIEQWRTADPTGGIDQDVDPAEGERRAEQMEGV